MNIVEWFTNLWNTLWVWMTSGGTVWMWATLLVALNWVCHWVPNGELQWLKTLLNGVAFMVCVTLLLIGDATSFASQVSWGMHWVWPIGGLFGILFLKEGKFVSVSSGGGAKASAGHH
ncbi:MAG: hypothetical protein HYT30_00960 [Parcubacteria group bacterium]|nr:hypothetical protein [Parcubacteria group bacterium]